MFGKLLGRFEGECIDVRVSRPDLAIIGTAKNHRYHVIFKCRKKLFGGIIIAYRVLKGKHIKVRPFEIVVAGTTSGLRAHMITTGAVHVNVEVPLQLLNKLFSLTICIAVTDHPDSLFLLGLPQRPVVFLVSSGSIARHDLPVRLVDVGVVPIRHGPVEHIVHIIEAGENGVRRRLHGPKDPLLRLGTPRREVIHVHVAHMEDDGVAGRQQAPVVGDGTLDGTFASEVFTDLLAVQQAVPGTVERCPHHDSG